MRRSTLLMALAVAATLGGCGKKGPPLPPLPKIPVSGGALEARQAGDLFELRVPLPTALASGSAIDVITGLKIYRVERPLKEDGTPPLITRRAFGDHLEPVLTLPPLELEKLTPGEIFIHQEAAGKPGVAVAFSARFSAVGNKWSTPASPAVLVPGEAPPVPVEATVTSVASGARLDWPPAGPVAVFRTQPGRPFPLQPMTVVAAGTGTFLDPTALFGRTWLYELRAVAGEKPHQRYSTATPVLEVKRDDRFPPAPPAGISALPRAGGVDLFWTPGPESDLAGYRVYRRALPEGEWRLATPETLTANTWTDTDVAPGVEYAYRLTSVDDKEPANESEPGETRRVRVPAPGVSSSGENRP